MKSSRKSRYVSHSHLQFGEYLLVSAGHKYQSGAGTSVV